MKFESICSCEKATSVLGAALDTVMGSAVWCNVGLQSPG